MRRLTLLLVIALSLFVPATSLAYNEPVDSGEYLYEYFGPGIYCYWYNDGRGNISQDCFAVPYHND